MKTYFKSILILLVIFSLASCKNKESELRNNPLFSARDKSEELRQQQQPIETTIKFDQENFDFKDIKKGDKVSHVFTFTNTGKKPLILSSVVPTCGCTTPEYTKTPVAPGKKGSITANFNSSNFEGTVHKTVKVYGNFKQIDIKFQANILKP